MFVMRIECVSTFACGCAHLRMLRVRRMIRVLRRLCQLRHVDVVLGPLLVARVDVGARDSAGLLRTSR